MFFSLVPLLGPEGGGLPLGNMLSNSGVYFSITPIFVSIVSEELESFWEDLTIGLQVHNGGVIMSIRRIKMKQVYKGFGFLKKEAMDGYICCSCKRDGYIERWNDGFLEKIIEARGWLYILIWRWDCYSFRRNSKFQMFDWNI